MSDILMQLDEVLETRRSGDPTSSYVAKLHALGLDEILEKIGEETVELIVAAKNCDSSKKRTEVVCEMADLWFHCMVLLSHLDGNVTEILDCLRERFGVSGLEEKASRSK